jgi:hypothetical protein
LVSVDVATLPAPPAGAGSVGSHTGQAEGGAAPGGFAALLDLLTDPSAALAVPPAIADLPNLPSIPGVVDRMPAEPEVEKQDEPGDDKGVALGLDAGAVPVGWVPLVEPLVVASVFAGTTEVPEEWPPGVVVAVEEPVPNPLERERVVPAVTRHEANDVMLVTGMPATALTGADTPFDDTLASAAPESPETDGPRLPELERNSRPQAGWDRPLPTSPQATATNAAVAAEPRLPGAQTTEANTPGASVVLQPHARIESTEAERQAPRPDRSRPGAPALPLRTLFASPTPVGPLHTGAESYGSSGWSGHGFARGWASPQGLPRSAEGASSERVSTGFVVPTPVAELPAHATEALSRAAAADAGRLQDPNEVSLEGQLVQTIRTLWRGGVSEARVTLKPEYLGAVTISLRLEGGGVQAHLQVEDPQVAAWVQANESLLKSGLAGQGLTLERLVVSEDGTSPDQRGQQGDRERREPRRQGRGTQDGAGFTLEA